MFNAKKRRIKELEGQIQQQQFEVKTYKAYFERAEYKAQESVKELETANYKLGLVEQLMKQLTININMNGKGKK